MKKRGQTEIYSVVIMLIIAFMFAGVIWSFVQANPNRSVLEKKFLSRDIALAYDAMLLTDNPVTLRYPIIKKYEIKLDKKDGLTKIKIKDLQEMFANEYEIITTKDTEVQTTSLGEEHGAELIELEVDKTGLKMMEAMKDE